MADAQDQQISGEALVKGLKLLMKPDGKHLFYVIHVIFATTCFNKDKFGH